MAICRSHRLSSRWRPRRRCRPGAGLLVRRLSPDRGTREECRYGFGMVRGAVDLRRWRMALIYCRPIEDPWPDRNQREDSPPGEAKSTGLAAMPKTLPEKSARTSRIRCSEVVPQRPLCGAEGRMKPLGTHTYAASMSFRPRGSGAVGEPGFFGLRCRRLRGSVVLAGPGH